MPPSRVSLPTGSPNTGIQRVISRGLYHSEEGLHFWHSLGRKSLVVNTHRSTAKAWETPICNSLFRSQLSRHPQLPVRGEAGRLCSAPSCWVTQPLCSAQRPSIPGGAQQATLLHPRAPLQLPAPFTVFSDTTEKKQQWK